jgi:DNA-binding NtrC family response regulator
VLTERREELPLPSRKPQKRRVTPFKTNRVAEDVAKETMRRLLAYAWPGNLRELENIIERAVILANGTILEMDPHILSLASAAAEASQKLTLEGGTGSHRDGSQANGWGHRRPSKALRSSHDIS